MVKDLLAGRYLLEEQIARGGMGEVWRARDEVLNRPVAVKLLHDSLAGDEKAAERFRREALTAAQISHPNMANVFDYIEEGGQPGIVMELVPGETLAHRLAKKKKIPIREAVRMTDDVLSALSAAHAAGIVHRDIKPANILLTPAGEVKVTDFGIARSLSDASLTQTGTVMGTAHYSAPEQVRGESASPASDIYSMGVVLYEMLTGKRPYSGDTPIAVAMARLSEDPPHPKELRSTIPAALDAVVMRALAREPRDRFASAAEMRMALDQAAAGAPIDQTQVLAIEGADETMALGALVRDEPKEGRLAAAVPPGWVGKRLAKLLVPLIVVALLVWGLVAAFGGPTTTKIPSFQGMTLTAAEQAAARAHLKVQTQSAPSDTVRKGYVVSQNPLPSSTPVVNGTTVTLVISSGPRPCCTMPNLVGKSLTTARSALSALGLKVGIVTMATSAQPVNTVIGQVPGPGGTLKPGDPVDLTVSAGQPKPPSKRKHGKG
jgi:eukaryotic-like serine/threonine-protein kinase